MVFSSTEFLFYFLPAILLAYYSIPDKAKNTTLLIASYIFYGWWDYRFTVLMLASTLISYYSVKLIPSRPKLGLVLPVVLNLSILGFFKYFTFLQENLNHFANLPILNVILPIGISFYLFQNISYIVDVYRGNAKPARSLTDYACYIALFPQLIAGPIIRYTTIEHQLTERKHDNVPQGIALFILGLSKKVILADSIAVIADTIFATADPGFIGAWIGILAYTYQIYFDFSGYSDMAIGLGMMLGFKFPKNFDSPYLSRSITEFWRRWHISLSSFLRDYLYIPLGGNRLSPTQTYINLSIVMLLGGLWHGANWTFILWGALHGILLISERILGKRPVYFWMPGPLRTMLTFIIIMLTWVPFRSESIGAAWKYYQTMFTVELGRSPFWMDIIWPSNLLWLELVNPHNIIILLLCSIICTLKYQSNDFAGKITWARTIALLALFVLSIGVMQSHEFSPFLYFQF